MSCHKVSYSYWLNQQAGSLKQHSSCSTNLRNVILQHKTMVSIVVMYKEYDQNFYLAASRVAQQNA
jgi:hypothetical protein